MEICENRLNIKETQSTIHGHVQKTMEIYKINWKPIEIHEHLFKIYRIP